MSTVTLDSALETAMHLDPEERDMLVDILRSRQIELHREELVRDVQEALAEYRRGEAKTMTPSEIMKEAIDPSEDENN